MHFDENNQVIKLCAEGMGKEMQGNNEDASRLFLQAWELAANNFEKFTAAHFVARQQDSVEGKLEWDIIALDFALKVNDESVMGSYPSLYLNIGKGYEDLGDMDNAGKFYQSALSYTHLLPENEYGNMIKGGIENAIQRVS